MASGYFHSVTEQTRTRFWINNPSTDELDKALAAGAISCTTNPTYGAKLLKSEPETIHRIIDRVILETEEDDSAADRVYHEAAVKLIDRFLPLYERSGGTEGFVTIQGDPRKEDD